MGCSTSRIDHLPAVSLCHDRCKFLEEALYQSYVLADSHVAYMHSLKTLGPALSRFFDHNLENNSQSDSAAAKLNPPPDHCPSSSDSDSHLDFPSDDSDDEEKEKETDLLQRINTDSFDRQTPTPSRTNSNSYRYYNKYDGYANNGGYGAISPPDGGYAWKIPSPPPPPPSGSTWEFLNFFETYDRFELPTKDKERIHEVKFDGDSMRLAKEEKPSKKTDDAKKNELDVEIKPVSEKKDSTESAPLMVIKELEALFDRAAVSGNEVLKILDTGKFRYYHKNSLYQGVSSKILHVVAPSFLVTHSKIYSTEKIGLVPVGFDEDSSAIAVNLSSTLKKLGMWEKKLYDEVKEEEKLRIMLARSYRQIKNMVDKGAKGTNKADSAADLIRALSTKIKVAIHVIDRTSITINQLRDEELWPLISLLIQKLLGMWKSMLDCHKCQSQAILQAKNLDSVVSNGIKFSETHLETAMQLKIDLQNWHLSFSDWVTAQKDYARVLNGWLLKYRPNEPQELPNETSEPPMFAFCNQWSAAAGRISETEVINAIHEFFIYINQLVERHYTELQQKVAADKELEKRMKILEKKEKMMQRILQSRSKNASGIQFSREGVHRSEVTYNGSFHLSLRQIFMAMEKFSANSVKVYEELHMMIEKYSLNRGNR
ncbi:protein ALTERED PHOSPHATE STARVATION RESPONSE 1-like [Mercurialis annua]|uniref:protein ALTERED PHOSPHATE STARVATION RESPONSE 1-like n=1 Tax=Mercurialis annua TaxID=3986 RepID=UPI00215F0C58|nr:protein ALTERED PHOSPHATE STARVATION RESPONSE 1-like [Mercurialis annua]